MKNRLMRFRAMGTEAALQDSYPVPSNRCLPEHYRRIPAPSTKTLELDAEHRPKIGVKGCMPFLDAMLSGYTYRLRTDVHIDVNNDGSIRYTYPYEQVIAHRDPSLPPVLGYVSTVEFLWLLRTFPETPKGYSTLFTHPLNRPDLPFYTFSGVVDTDNYYAFKDDGNVPFLLKIGFTGVIPAGTPIAQCIPFPRERWDHTREVATESEMERFTSSTRSTFLGAYKRLYRAKKFYH